MAWLELHFELFVIAFAIGIALYFTSPFEPPLRPIVFFMVLATGIGTLLIRLKPSSLIVAALIWAALFGFLRGSWHTAETNRHRLPAQEYSYDVTGWIKAVEKSGPRLRWQVKVKQMEGRRSIRAPEIIRVTTFDRSMRAGDFVRFSARLSAPPGPAIPGGYDPGFRAFFQKVGGYGYMVSKPERLDVDKAGFRQLISRRITQIRYGMAKRIMEQAPDETAGLQTALLTGIRSWVPEDQTLALRAGGLAHILAISGLHMGLVAGGFYALALFILVRIGRLARRSDIRKPAAILGIIAASLYLVLSGASVATQRAYIMAVIVFLAMVLDRQAISIRSVAVAGMITLCLHPESLVMPGFQMSFSAVTALVVVYRAWDKRRVYTGPRNLLKRFWDGLKALTMTSFVAGTATSGFAVLHFNRIASFSLIGNLAAMPIFTFWVMPLAIVVYLLMPFGLEAAPLWLMGQGLDVILVISEWVEGLPGAIQYLPSGPAWLVAIFGLAFTALCLGQNKLRLGSIGVMCACSFILISRPEPQIRIADSGAIALWQNVDGQSKLYVDRQNTDRYGRQQFIEAMGLNDVETEAFNGSLAQCDQIGCVLNLQGRSIRILHNLEEIDEDCENVDLVIVPKRQLGARARRFCQARIIDSQDINLRGAHSVYIGGDGIKVKTAHQDYAKRPWQTGQTFKK